MGRPRKKIDVAAVEKMAAMLCTTVEIADVVGCSKDTLERRFAAIIEKGRQEGRCSLRRKQMAVAMDDTHRGQTTMLIWMGKQHLGQSDKQEFTAMEAPPQLVITTTAAS